MLTVNVPYNAASKTGITTRILSGFDDPYFSEKQWMELLGRGNTNTVNLTWRWQRCWWNCFGKGDLMLILAEQDELPVALAPLFVYERMIFNLCPEDALDFVGDISAPEIVDAILVKAIAQIEHFAGFRFYFIPDHSLTGHRLQEAAVRLHLSCYEEGALPSPFINLKADPESASELTRKKSLRRHENFFLRTGQLEIHHYQTAEDILPHLDEFFDQHIRRRAATPHPSIFLQPEQAAYYRTFTKEVSDTGWLRFTRISWNSRAIAFHYGLCYNGRYLFGIPSFDIDLSEHSPGEVLLRQVLLAAIKEDAETFDFGVGDEAYKYRFATHSSKLHNWGLYPTATTNK